jgi:hypothetical protein
MFSNVKSNENINDNVDIEIGAADKSLLSGDIGNQIGDRPVIEIHAKIKDKVVRWNNPDAPVVVSIDYKPTAGELMDLEHIVVLYIDDAGKAVSVPSGRYNNSTGKVTFTTTHFSKYAVGFVKKTFSDIDAYSWARKQIEVLASKGVIKGTSEIERTLAPSANITRADFICLLVNALELNAQVDSNFVDIEEGKYYYEAVGIAKKLGITDGVGDNMFKPNSQITRQDMMVIVAKALKVAGKDVANADMSEVEKYTDSNEVAGYAATSIASLVKEGIVRGSADKLNPNGQTTRADVSVIMYLIYNK